MVSIDTWREGYFEVNKTTTIVRSASLLRREKNAN